MTVIDIEYIQNNLSTIAVLIYGALSPFLAQYLSSEQFSASFIAIVSVVLIIYSAKHPNTFKVLGNAPEPLQTEETVMNDEYEAEI